MTPENEKPPTDTDNTSPGQSVEVSSPQPKAPSDEAIDVAEVGSVFISYRVTLDETLAVALRRLIEESLNPSPKVFVSNSGGLVPSQFSLKRQIQDAASDAAFFVGIITDKSKDRDWVIFEAGAAWGRETPYAPVLVDVDVQFLPSMISDMYATPIASEEKMFLLLEQIAVRCRCHLKTHFGNRFAALERSVNEYLRRNNPTKVLFPSDDQARSKFEAYEALTRGDVQEAERLIMELAAQANTVEEKAHIMLDRVMFGPEQTNRKKLLLLESWSEPLRGTYTYKLWRSILETHPKRALSFANEAVALGKEQGLDHSMAAVQLLRCHLRVDDMLAVGTVMRESVTSGDWRLRSAVVLFILEEWPKALDMLRFVMLLLAVSEEDNDRCMSALANTAASLGCMSIAVWAASRYAMISRGPSGELLKGIVCHAAGLHGLAFEAYTKAGDGGINVAWANIALLSSSFPVPKAALNYLDRHPKPWDSADKGYPHEVRSRIERTMQAEEERENTLRKAGAKAVGKLSKWLSSLDLATDQQRPLGDSLVVPWDSERKIRIDTTSDGTVSFAAESKAHLKASELELVPLNPLLNLWVYRIAGEYKGILYLNQDLTLQGYALELRRDEPVLVGVHFTIGSVSQ